MRSETQEVIGVLSRLGPLDERERLRVLESTAAGADRLIRLAEAADRLAIDDLNLALQITPVIATLADRCGEPRARIRTRRAGAQALAYASRFTEALELLSEALELAESACDDIEAARIRMTRLHALAKLGRHADALREGEQARRSFVAAGAATLAAKADINLGVTRRMADDPIGALRHFDRARPLLAGERLVMAQLDSNRAEALLDLGRFAEAEEAFREALASFNDLEAGRAAAIVEGNLGDLMGRQGRLEESLYHFERARRRLEGGASPGEVARLVTEQAEAFAAVGLFEAALENYQQAIDDLEDHGHVRDAARAHTGRGRTLTLMGRLEEAARAGRV